MYSEVKTYKFTCDHCNKVAFVRDALRFERPADWHHYEGNKHYIEDLCEECYQKREYSFG
jgi:hypothetical protein